MTADSASTNSKERFFLIISLVLAPAIMLYFALDYFEKQKNSKLFESARLQLMEPLNNIKQYKNIEAFWCATLNEEIYNSGNPVELSERIERLARITGEQLKYVIWRGKSRVELSNFLTRDQFKIWDNLINDAQRTKGISDPTEIRKKENRVKMLLGPHYLAENLNLSQDLADPHFIRSDNAGHLPLVWINHKHKFSALVLFKPDIITRDHRLKLFFNNRQPAGSHLHLIDIRNTANLTGKHATALKAACFSFIKNGNEISQIDNRLIGIVRASPVEFVANLIIVESCTGNSGRNTKLITLLTLFVLVIALRSKPDFLHPNNISIRVQLLTLLFICSGLPLLSLALGGLEHLKQQREHLIRSAYQTCIKYIQEIDRHTSGEYSRIMQQSHRAVNEFKRLLKDGAPERDTIIQTFSIMHPSRKDFWAIASSANYLIGHTGIYRDGVFNKYSADNFLRTDVPAEIKVINDIGSYYLNFMNRTQIDPKRYAEIEMLTEMFYRKSLTEVVHGFLLISGNIAALGWGATAFPVFVNLVSIHDPKIADYFFWAAYTPDLINRAYVARQIDNMRRNEFGLNIFFYDQYDIFPLDPDRDNSELIDLFVRTGTHPALEPQLCIYDRQNWVIAGFKGSLLNNFKIIALYPMSRIDDAIKKEGHFIIYSVLTAFTILVSLTLLFGHSFTVPLAHLQSAAEAVEKREFGFKLPDLGRDEFGEMGRVFNRSIAELEELAIASIVQSRLMPAKTIEAGHFDIFGRSVPMADLGGAFRVSTAQGHGTVVEMIVPYSSRKAHARGKDQTIRTISAPVMTASLCFSAMLPGMASVHL